MVEATAGEFYVGETVYIYRDPDYAYKHLVGVGTVVSGATEAYESEGRITAIHVSEGEYVEKGELLYEVIDGESTQIVAPADGIITACEAENGANIADKQSVASMVTRDEICVAVQVEDDQIAQIAPGDFAALSYYCDEQERQLSGTVIDISNVAQDGCYTVYISPEEVPAQLGLTVEARIDSAVS